MEPTHLNEHMLSKLLYEFCLCRTHFDGKKFSFARSAVWNIFRHNEILNLDFHSLDAAEAPADLSQRIVFKAKRKEAPEDEPSKKETGEKTSKRKKGKPVKNLLSFEEEDDV